MGDVDGTIRARRDQLVAVYEYLSKYHWREGDLDIMRAKADFVCTDPVARRYYTIAAGTPREAADELQSEIYYVVWYFNRLLGAGDADIPSARRAQLIALSTFADSWTSAADSTQPIDSLAASYLKSVGECRTNADIERVRDELRAVFRYVEIESEFAPARE
jgi:hypothetical protein